MKLYTKTGDMGQTGLIGGKRVPKDDAQVVCYGEVDELNAALGVARAACTHAPWRERLQVIQSDLFIMGAQLATQADQKPSHRLDPDRINALEQELDAVTDALPPLTHFVLPGGSELAARFHVARTICRRAERAVVVLSHQIEVDNAVLVYLNRLSDLLFAYALAANEQSGEENVLWIAPAKD
jgi:cob(I)alamin adenosyltransferase